MKGFWLLALLALALMLGVTRDRSAAVDFRDTDPFAIALRRMDANGDGLLSREEYVRYGRAVDFERYDENHDGMLDRAEYRKAWLTQEPDPAEIDPLMKPVPPGPPQAQPHGG